MSLDMENEQESLAEESKDTETDNEEINNCEQLEEKKHEFNVEGNSAQNQIFIQDAVPGGFTINYYAEKLKSDVPKLSVEEKYDLRIQRECIEFTEKFVNSEYFTIAFLLCVFKAVPLTDLAHLRLKVENCLMKSKIRSDAEQEEYTQKDNSCVSLNSIFAVIGANKFIVADDKLCVGIGENSTRALINMLEQFPMLHDLYEKFMSEIIQDSKYHDSSYEIQLAASIAEVWATRDLLQIMVSFYGNFTHRMHEKSY